MEMLLVLAVLALALGAVLLHRRQQAVAWDRELESAFGRTADREIPRHRVL